MISTRDLTGLGHNDEAEAAQDVRHFESAVALPLCSARERNASFSLLMPENALGLVKESYSRYNPSELVRRFYELFVASSPEVAEKFANTDVSRQQAMLVQSLQMMLIAPEAEGEGALKDYLDHIGRRHSRADLDIPAWMYQPWVDCLIEALRESDPDFNPDIERAWRTTMLAGIEQMQSHY